MNNYIPKSNRLYQFDLVKEILKILYYIDELFVEDNLLFYSIPIHKNNFII